MWTPPERSPEALALNAAAETDRVAHPEKYRLDPDQLLAHILPRLPEGGPRPDDWQEGFRVYIDAAREEGRLTALGLRNVSGTAMGKARGRHELAAAMQADPSIRQRKIDRPIFIIGGWRTGTTLLQRLLAGVPGLRGAFPAELTVPWRFNGLDAEAREQLVVSGRKAHDLLHKLNPTMMDIHPSGATLPEECVLAMGTDFRNWGFTSTLRCPSYAGWLLDQDMTASYALYADVLRLLELEDGRRWVLKAPAHTAALPALWANFPDAIVLHLHRDVVQTVTSGASLFAVFRSTYSDDVDPADVGRYQLDMTATWFDRAMAARDANPSAKVVDIDFRKLVADPVGMIAGICQAIGLDWTQDRETAARTRLAELNRQHGSHRYAPEDFGLDPEEIRTRMKPYTERFGLDVPA